MNKTHEGYTNMFNKMGIKRTKKLVNYMQMKVIKYDTDYTHPQRLLLMKTLNEMKQPFKEVFDEDMIN